MDMHTDDLQLVERCRAGDTDAFGELIRRYESAVFNLAWRISGSWHEAGDITQEAFIRAYTKLDTYRSEYAFRNWVMRIGANVAKNIFRSRQRRERTERVAALESGNDLAGYAVSHDDAVERALAQLPESLRTALVMKHIEGMAYEEIARTLGIGTSAAKMRVARGRDALVRMLDDPGENHHAKSS